MVIPVTPRSVGLMLVATLAAGWFETVSTPNSQAPQQSSRAAARHQDLRSAVTTVPSTERLRSRRTETPAPARGRNPFIYGSRLSPQPTGVSSRRDEVAAVAPAEVPADPVTLFKLSGIAANVENGATVLTAIVIDNGTMVFAKTGDTLSNGHSVLRVEEGSITLVNATGVTQTIRLP